ncbi:hypothetical protein ACFV1L_10575 [Kitasatospora sp. NPDC059646]|uniref:hypothetical protein n=1 Tax=Kitasatospora sp. NPDC059646 TaxID=3346893 RepID=UPI0036D200F1
MPRPVITPEEAAERLGIADEFLPAFLAAIDAWRTPEARDTELAKLRQDAEKVDEILIDAGITYPLGVAGVRDLAGALELAREGDDA